MEQGAIIIQELTGQWPVYPGHPLVLATAIMRVFSTYAEANRPTGHGYCQALADSRIPGAGDHVAAAMRTLELGARGEDVDAMIAHASLYWEHGQAGGHVKNVAAGKAQAEKVEPHFRTIASEWFKQTSAEVGDETGSYLARVDSADIVSARSLPVSTKA